MKKLNTIRKALKFMGGKYEGTQAEIMLLAIGYQESGFKHRKQINGPALGFWQFEPIAVKEILTNPSTRAQANEVCRRLEVDPSQVYQELENNDVLAVCFARLLLWRDPDALPGHMEEAWSYYIRNWAPGKPRPEHWSENYKKSIYIVMGEKPENNPKYRLYFTEEQAPNLGEYLEGADPQPVFVAEIEISPEQANELACMREDGHALDIVPPKGDPPAECDR